MKVGLGRYGRTAIDAGERYKTKAAIRKLSISGCKGTMHGGWSRTQREEELGWVVVVVDGGGGGFMGEDVGQKNKVWLSGASRFTWTELLSMFWGRWGGPLP